MKFSTAILLCAQAMAVISMPVSSAEPKFMDLVARSADPVDFGQSWSNAAASAAVGTAVNMALKKDDRAKAAESIKAGYNYAKDCINCAVNKASSMVRGKPQGDVEAQRHNTPAAQKPSRIPKYVGSKGANPPPKGPPPSRIPRPVGGSTRKNS
jgi:hypothetical protein